MSRKGLLAALIVLGLACLGTVALLAHRAWCAAPFQAALEAARAKDTSAALAQLAVAAERPGKEAEESELRGQVLLMSGERVAAQAALAGARSAGVTGMPALSALSLAKDLLGSGREAELLVLTEHLEATANGGLGTELNALAASAHHAAGDLSGAVERYQLALGERTLKGPGRDQLAGLLARAKAELSAGRMPIVFGRDGSELAWRRHGGELDLGPELAGLVGAAELAELPGLQQGELDGQVILTLDPVMERHALRAFRREQGAFVVLDVNTGDILAAAGSRDLSEGAPPFATRFQPGSTLKVLTMAAFLDSGGEAGQVLPFNCKGNDFVLEGEILYDWSAHGNIKDLGRALATSCNTVFCKQGLRLGDTGLRRYLAPLGLDGEALQGAAGETFGVGRLPAGPLAGKRLARTAIGLDGTTVSPVQAALSALVFARGGELLPARFVKVRKNVVGTVLESSPNDEPAATRVFSAKAAKEVVRGMRRVVEDADGTGRGVRAAGVKVALKTGTTGGDGQPLNAAFVGFLPAERPEIAFAFFTQGSGRSLEVSRRVLGPLLKDIWRDRSMSAPGYSG